MDLFGRLAGSRGDEVDPHRVIVVMWNARGSGGVARTVLNLANYLAETRDVEVVSVQRRRHEPKFPISPRIRVTYLADEDPEKLARLVASRRPSVVITTRPALHRTLVRSNGGRHVLIGQDHLNFETRMANREVAAALEESVAALDGFTVLTNADARDYRAAWPDARADIRVMRNASPFPAAEKGAPLESPIVISAGRLGPQKGFHRLIEAWAPIAREFPEWEVQICGEGPLRAELQQQIDDLGLGKQMKLLGHVSDLQERLANCSFYAMSAIFEGFHMVLAEAMSQGVPAIAYDCPRGPGEIITDGYNGRLIPDGDREAYTEALRGLITDVARRKEMGAAALEHARANYRLEDIGRQWEEFIDQLAGEHNARLVPRRR